MIFEAVEAIYAWLFPSCYFVDRVVAVYKEKLSRYKSGDMHLEEKIEFERVWLSFARGEVISDPTITALFYISQVSDELTRPASEIQEIKRD